jgi:hypothetical protein
VDLLLLHGQVLGRIADYERAAELAEMLVSDAPDAGTARMARARTRATLHRFAEALADLEAANDMVPTGLRSTRNGRRSSRGPGATP